ncbi:hypothetical protein BJ944DRAFT_244279 [Cunninghamella echinulata]|nr:hypothetical protein BJ944DRAFT_244279 [Cunninghamella echinulata]
MNDILDTSDSSSESSLEVPLLESQQNFINQLQQSNYNNNNNNNLQDDLDDKISLNRPRSNKEIEAKANYLNLLLTAQGYPVPIIFQDKNDQDTLKLLGCFQTVLQDIKKYQDERDHLNEIIIELRQEQQNTQKQLDQYMTDLDNKERELAKAKLKIESTNQQLKKEIENNRHIKEELSKTKNNMQYMKSQYAHETRKHEQEHAKTRERLNKLMNEKIKTNVITMSINTKSAIAELDMEPERKAIEDERSMQKDLIEKCTNRERKAIKESEQLKTVVVKIFNSVRRLLENQLESYEESFGNIESQKQINQEIAKYSLPTEFNGDYIINQVNDLLDRLQQEWGRQITDRKLYTEEDIQEKDQLIENYQSQLMRLEETIENIQQEYEQKEKVYLQFVKGGFFDEIVTSHALDISDSEDSVAEDGSTTLRLQHFYNKAKREQQKVTENAIKLGNERTKLEAEKWAFEEVKRQEKLTEIMNDIPTTSSNQNKRRKYS